MDTNRHALAIHNTQKRKGRPQKEARPKEHQQRNNNLNNVSNRLLLILQYTLTKLKSAEAEYNNCLIKLRK